MNLSQDEIIIEGWALIPYSQHYSGSNTHEYHLDVVGNTHSFKVPGKVTSKNLTRFFDFKGWNRCKKGAVLVQSCNYEMENVGFEFRVKLADLKVDEDYNLFIKMHAKQSRLKYRIPLFYVGSSETIKDIGRNNYTILSSYKHTSFNVYKEHHYTRTTPSPYSEALKIGKSCSNSYGNTAYFKHLTTFKNIDSITKFDDLVTYFKVPVKVVGCSGGRQRVIEDKTSNIYAFIPSTGVNYLGKPTSIQVRTKQSEPILSVTDVELYENDPYNPFDYASATDKYDGDISNKIEVTSSNVNSSVPGLYKTCYSVTNSLGLSSNDCSNVSVLKRPRKHRFISTYSIHNTYLRLWNRTTLKELIRSQEVKHRIVIKR